MTRNCSCCFIKNRHHLVDALSITPPYLRNDVSDSGEVIDFRNWGIPLSRRFRALKIWFVIRTHGVLRLKSYVRNHIRLGELFAALIASRPDLFKVVGQPAFALTAVSILPRVPSVLRKLLAFKAKKASRSRVPKGSGIQENKSSDEQHRPGFSNGQPDSGDVLPLNGEPGTSKNAPSNNELHKCHLASLDGYFAGTNVMSTKTIESSTNSNTNGYREPKMDGNVLASDYHPSDAVEANWMCFSDGKSKSEEPQRVSGPESKGTINNSDVRADGGYYPTQQHRKRA